MNEKLIIRALLLVLGCLIMVSLVACGSAATNNQAQTPIVNNDVASANQAQTTDPSQSDLALHVIADGRLCFVEDRKLTFRTSGVIDQVNVNEGDKVTKGQVLVKLGTDTLEMAKMQAQVSLSQAELSLTQAQLAQKSAEYELSVMDDQEVALDLALTNAEANLEIAQYALDQAEEIGGPEVAIKTIQRDAAEMAVDLADQNIDRYPAQIKLKRSQVQVAEDSVEQSKQSIALAQQALDETQKRINEATLSAPFDGVIAKVGVKEGDYLSPVNYATTVAIEIIDIRRMELVLNINELDIPNVKVGQKVSVSVDALPDARFDSMVTSISSLPVVQSGVYSYEVKVVFDVPQNSTLRAGMRATADIVTDKRS